MMPPICQVPGRWSYRELDFPQNISIASGAAFGDLLDNHRGASTRPIDRIIWLPLVCGPIVRLLAARA